MPDRIIRDEILTSDKWLSVPRNSHRLAYICLLLSADALGNLEGSDAALWRIWRDPLRLDTRQAVPEILEALVSSELVRLYDAGGKRFIHIPRYQQRLRYLGRILPPSPWTTEDEIERIQKVTKKSPGDRQAQTGSAPGAHRIEVEVEVKRSEVEEKRSRSEDVPPTPQPVDNSPSPTINTVLKKLTVNPENRPQLSREEQLAYVKAQAGKP